MIDTLRLSLRLVRLEAEESEEVLYLSAWQRERYQRSLWQLNA